MIPVDSVDDVLKYSLAVEDKDKFYEQLQEQKVTQNYRSLRHLPQKTGLTLVVNQTCRSFRHNDFLSKGLCSTLSGFSKL